MSGTEHVTAATRTVDANGDGYPTKRTALLLIDPYNDFLSEGGKPRHPLTRCATPPPRGGCPPRFMREILNHSSCTNTL